MPETPPESEPAQANDANTQRRQFRKLTSGIVAGGDTSDEVKRARDTVEDFLKFFPDPQERKESLRELEDIHANFENDDFSERFDRAASHSNE